MSEGGESPGQQVLGVGMGAGVKLENCAKKGWGSWERIPRPESSGIGRSLARGLLMEMGAVTDPGF